MKRKGSNEYITIVSVGKLKEKYLKQGIDEYMKRLGSYCKFKMSKCQTKKAPENLSDKEMGTSARKRGRVYPLLQKLKMRDVVVAMAIEGDSEFRTTGKEMDTFALHGKSSMVFVIGGSLRLKPSREKTIPTVKSIWAYYFTPSTPGGTCINRTNLPCIPY